MSLLIFNDTGIALFRDATCIVLGMFLLALVTAIRQPTRDNISGVLMWAALDSLLWWYLVGICWDSDGHLTKKFGEHFVTLVKYFPWTVPPLLTLAAIVVSKMKPGRPTPVQVEPPDTP